MRPVHRVLGVFLVRRARTALVKSHHDVCAYLALYVHHALRREEQFASVDVTAETHTLFVHLADVGQTEDLKTAGVRQDRSVPSLKAMQSTGFAEDLGARTKEEMVRVAKDDLRFDVVFQLLTLHTFHGAHCTHRHENRGQYIPMIRVQHTCSCADTLRFAM